MKAERGLATNSRHAPPARFVASKTRRTMPITTHTFLIANSCIWRKSRSVSRPENLMTFMCEIPGSRSLALDDRRRLVASSDCTYFACAVTPWRTNGVHRSRRASAYAYPASYDGGVPTLSGWDGILTRHIWSRASRLSSIKSARSLHSVISKTAGSIALASLRTFSTRSCETVS